MDGEERGVGYLAVQAIRYVSIEHENFMSVQAIQLVLNNEERVDSQVLQTFDFE
jgi:hypothetical protein